MKWEETGKEGRVWRKGEKRKKIEHVKKEREEDKGR